MFPRNVRLLQEVAETVGDRKAQQHLEKQQLEQTKRRQKRRILEPILPLGAGVNSEACRFCAHSPQGYCRHHFHLQELKLHQQRQTSRVGGDQEYKQLRRIKRELKRSLGQRQPQLRSYRPLLSSSLSCSSLSSGYGSLSTCSTYADEEEEHDESVEVEEPGNLVTTHL